MKRLLSLSMFLMMALLSFAHDFEVKNADGKTIYYEITSSSDLTVAVTYRGTSSSQYSNEYTGAVNIPATVTYNEKTYSVTSIGNYAFRNCSSLTSVTIPNSVTSIGYEAFDGCSGLTSVTIPNSVTSIGEDAFRDCSGLTKVIVPDIAAWCNISFGNYYANPLYYAKHIYSDENTEIKDLVIPNSVTAIGSWAFYECSGLTSVTIPNSVKTIGWSAFDGCSGLTSVTIPNSVTSIGSWAFNDCSGISSFILHDNITSIGFGAFDTKIYVNTGTKTLFALWSCETPNVYNKETKQKISRPTLSASATQATLKVFINEMLDGYTYTCNGKIMTDNVVFDAKGLMPGFSKSFSVKILLLSAKTFFLI